MHANTAHSRTCCVGGGSAEMKNFLRPTPSPSHHPGFGFELCSCQPDSETDAKKLFNPKACVDFELGGDRHENSQDLSGKFGFVMVLSSNSRSAEIPDTKGVTRSAFIEVGVLDSVARYPLGLRLPAGPAFLHTSAPAPVHRNPTTHPHTQDSWIW